jgi:hypothetical protein
MLRYDEPPSWIQPGAPRTGRRAPPGRFSEAEAVFREDLARQPENGWGLYELMRSLQLQRKTGEAASVEKRFDTAWKNADIRIKSACLCLPGV